MKCIYQPKGKAREYAPWACNLYNGCPNRCDYCYNRSGLGLNTLGRDQATLKQQLVNPETARHIFCTELQMFRERIIADGGELFFSFVSDPCLAETRQLTFQCIDYCCSSGIKAVILTKCADLFLDNDDSTEMQILYKHRRMIRVGFTLTGRDDLEPFASTNEERIEAIRKLFFNGFKVWVSAEPIIDLCSSHQVFFQTIGFVHHYAFGLRSAGSHIAAPYRCSEHDDDSIASSDDLRLFRQEITCEAESMPDPPTITWKESFLSFVDR